MCSWQPDCELRTGHHCRLPARVPRQRTQVGREVRAPSGAGARRQFRVRT